MRATRNVQKILANYEGETPGVKANLCRILMEGKLGGTGKLIILPVDQGFVHGPARSFAANPAGYDPHYHYQLAIDAGMSAYAAPLGPLEAGADTFAGQIPTILKVNSANSLMSDTAGKNQAVTASVDDALRLGCAAIGFTIYPGSDMALDMFEEIVEMRKEAAAKGVAKNASGAIVRGPREYRRLNANVSQPGLVSGIDQALDDHLERRTVCTLNDLGNKLHLVVRCAENKNIAARDH